MRLMAMLRGKMMEELEIERLFQTRRSSQERVRRKRIHLCIGSLFDRCEVCSINIRFKKTYGHLKNIPSDVKSEMKEYYYGQCDVGKEMRALASRLWV